MAMAMRAQASSHRSPVSARSMHLATRDTQQRAPVTCRSIYGTAGDVLFELNRLSLGRNDPRLRRVKACIDKAVAEVFCGHATVQHQGSTRKGTGHVGSDKLPGSDWDFFVKLDNTIEAVTHNERIAVLRSTRRLLAADGIDYNMKCRKNRILMQNGSCSSDESGTTGYSALPDVDVVFQRFKLDERKPPNSKALAQSHIAQQVAKYIKRLPIHKTHLQQPKSFYAEQLVLQLLTNLQYKPYDDFSAEQLKGAAGFEKLLTAALQTIDVNSAYGSLREMQPLLQQAMLNSKEWQGVARDVLDRYRRGCGWLIV